MTNHLQNSEGKRTLGTQGDDRTYSQSVRPLLLFSSNLPTVKTREGLWNSVAQLIPKLLNAEGGAIILRDQKTQEVYAPAACIEDKEVEVRLRSIRFSGDKELPGDLFNAQSPSIVHDFIDSSDGFQCLDPFVCNYAANRLIAPLRMGDTVIGVLWAINKKKGRFNGQDTQLLCALAGGTAMAMENLNLRNQLAQSDQTVREFNLAKDRVIHHLSHALKTPLAVLIASVKLLEKHLNKLPEKGWRKICERAQRNLERLLTIEYEMEDVLRHRDSGSDAIRPSLPDKAPMAPGPSHDNGAGDHRSSPSAVHRSGRCDEGNTASK